MDGRPLAPRTVELYCDLLDRQILPTFGQARLSTVRTEHVRAWLGTAATATSPGQAAKAYRLLRTILTTAVEDERLALNPCKIRGGGVERAAERPFVDAEVVLDLDGAIEERYRAGRRAVHLPAIVTRALEDHLLQFTAARPDALVFTGPLSEALR